MKNISRNIKALLVFVLVIAGISLYYNYPETLLKRPQSVHNWRQCDGASLALNYYQEGMHFFKPQTHMLYSDGATTGYTAPSEIPLLYYFVAILYKLFGFHEYIFRAVNLLLFFMGLFYLFKLADEVLHDIFYSITVVVLIFSSTLLVYYANNFLPNTVALSFSLGGWYYFYRYYRYKATRTFLMSMLFFGIAGSMKVTELTGPVIILGMMVADKFGIIKIGLATDKRPLLKVFSIVFIIGIVAGWIMYAKHYNNLHGTAQFSTFTFPIWEMSKADIKEILHLMNVLWFKDYFYPVTFYFMLGCLILAGIFHRRADKVILWLSVAYTMAVVAFSMMWFMALGHHDYFFIGFYVLPAFLFINFFVIIKSFRYSKVYDIIIRMVFLLFMAVNVFWAQDRHSGRYSTRWINDYPLVSDLHTIGPWLEQTGISSDDTIIFYPSVYIRPLYLMNLKGWVIYDHAENNPEIELRDSLQMQTYMNNGAEYFITNDLKSAADYKVFAPYMKDLYGSYNSVYIFRIPPERTNFNPADTILLNNP
jgi:hypothetical protein